MNEFLHELATLGLLAGWLTAAAVALWGWQRCLQRWFPRAAGERRRLLLMLAGALVLIGATAWLALALDGPRRLLLDYLGLLLVLVLGAFALTLAADFAAGLQLRLRGAVRPGAVLSAGRYAGRVVLRGALQVTLETAAGDRICLPNRYLLRTPLLFASGELAATSLQPAVREVAAATAPASTAFVRREPTLEDTAGAALEADVAPFEQEPSLAAFDAAADGLMPTGRTEPMFSPEADAAAAMPRGGPAFAEPEELRQLKRDYTDMSQQLLALEQAMRDTAPGESRKSLSLDKKKLEARLARLEKQIDELAAGERRRA